VILFIRIFG